MNSSSKLIHDSIAGITEDKLVERLLSDPLWGSEFFELAGMRREMANRQQVPLDTVPGTFKGDIDVLLCDPKFPDEAVAYQFKRIKLGISHVQNGRPGKLQEYKKLAKQANLLAQAGFWQVYAYVVIVADTREQNSGRVTYEGISTKLKSAVNSAISLELLEDRVGLVILDFTQPMDHKPFTVGTHGLTVRRLSTPGAQSKELTKWVAELFS